MTGTLLAYAGLALGLWLAVAVPVAVVIGRAMRCADAHAAAMDRHPAGKAERHLRVVA